MKTSITKIDVPKGYSFKISKGPYGRGAYIRLHTIKCLYHIGTVNLEKIRTGYYATHSYLQSEYRNKGLGVLLYAKAIQYALRKGWKVQSSGASSEMAAKVWKSRTIRKYFTIKYKKSFMGPWADKWYAYAK